MEVDLNGRQNANIEQGLQLLVFYLLVLLLSQKG